MTGRPRTATTLVRAAALVLLLGLASCTAENADRDLPPPLVDSSPSTPGAEAPGTEEPGDDDPGAGDSPSGVNVDDALEVVSWGGHGDQLAVIVRNTSDEPIVEADVLIVGLDDSGNVMSSQRGAPGDRCCSIFGLAPDAEYALFAQLDHPVDELSDVEVRFDRIQQGGPSKATFTVEKARLETTADDAIVVADLRPAGPVGPHVVGQAVLVDRDDRPLAVISGHFYCFTEGRTRQVRMELTRPAPPGARLGEVMAHPVPPDVTLESDDQCSTPGETS